MTFIRIFSLCRVDKQEEENVEEKERDKKPYRSATARLKNVPFSEIEDAIARAIGGIVGEKLRCDIVGFTSNDSQCSITITFTEGKGIRG